MKIGLNASQWGVLTGEELFHLSSSDVLLVNKRIAIILYTDS